MLSTLCIVIGKERKKRGGAVVVKKYKAEQPTLFFQGKLYAL